MRNNTNIIDSVFNFSLVDDNEKQLNNNDYDIDIRRGLRRCFKYT